MPARCRRLLAAAAIALTLVACGRGARQYEYEEQLYLFPDGSATVVINSSIPALVALRGLPLDPSPRARLDRSAIRELVTEPGLEISRVSRPWRRDGRQFIQIRVETEDVRTLSGTRLLGWSTYKYSSSEDGRKYSQLVGAPAWTPPPNPGWDGTELVAFKLHLPSRIREDNETPVVERGNILTWEQHLSDRAKGQPVDMQVTMEPGSILYRTLWLFAASFGAAIGLLAFIVWRIVRRGRQRNAART